MPFLRKSTLLWALAILAALGSAKTSYGSIITVDGGWYKFYFGGPGSSAYSAAGDNGSNYTGVGDPPWTYSSVGSTLVTVTDAYNMGDSFSLYDFGNLVGSTPVVPSGLGGVNDPDVAVLDPSYSHSAFVLGAGSHSLTIVVDDSPFSSGGAFFRVDTQTTPNSVPEPTSVVLFGMGFLGLVALNLRRQK